MTTDVSDAITTLGFDADDTLWQSEQFYKLSEARFLDLLGDHAEGPDVSTRLLAAERRNLSLYGFGIKGFTLSMIETALEIAGPDAPARLVADILAIGREMLAHPVEPLPDAAETLALLAKDYRLVLVTKGDLFDQERKLAASGLGPLFHAVEIVSDKTSATYERVFGRHGDGPARGAMIGNSLKSDVLPALAAGAYGVYVPHDLTWVMEHADEPTEAPRYRRIERLGALPALLDELAEGDGEGEANS